jgi:hypothetical protein
MLIGYGVIHTFLTSLNAYLISPVVVGPRTFNGSNLAKEMSKTSIISVTPSEVM